MLGFGKMAVDFGLLEQFVHRGFILALLVAILGSSGVLEKLARLIQNKAEESFLHSLLYTTLSGLTIVFIMGVSTLFLVSDTYNPFIYFRF